MYVLNFILNIMHGKSNKILLTYRPSVTDHLQQRLFLVVAQAEFFLGFLRERGGSGLFIKNIVLLPNAS